jgi:hypothetical protein
MAFGHARDFLSVGWRGRWKHDAKVWTGHSWSDYASGLGAINVAGDVTVHTTAACCPPAMPRLSSTNASDPSARFCCSAAAVASDSDAPGAAGCAQRCCLTPGDNGCTTNGKHERLCSKLPAVASSVDPRGRAGQCDLGPGACSSDFGPRAERIGLSVSCHPHVVPTQ